MRRPPMFTVASRVFGVAAYLPTVMLLAFGCDAFVPSLA